MSMKIPEARKAASDSDSADPTSATVFDDGTSRTNSDQTTTLGASAAADENAAIFDPLSGPESGGAPKSSDDDDNSVISTDIVVSGELRRVETFASQSSGNVDGGASQGSTASKEAESSADEDGNWADLEHEWQRARTRRRDQTRAQTWRKIQSDQEALEAMLDTMLDCSDSVEQNSAQAENRIRSKPGDWRQEEGEEDRIVRTLESLVVYGGRERPRSTSPRTTTERKTKRPQSYENADFESNYVRGSNSSNRQRPNHDWPESTNHYNSGSYDSRGERLRTSRRGVDNSQNFNPYARETEALTRRLEALRQGDIARQKSEYQYADELDERRRRRLVEDYIQPPDPKSILRPSPLPSSSRPSGRRAHFQDDIDVDEAAMKPEIKPIGAPAPGKTIYPDPRRLSVDATAFRPSFKTNSFGTTSDNGRTPTFRVPAEDDYAFIDDYTDPYREHYSFPRPPESRDYSRSRSDSSRYIGRSPLLPEIQTRREDEWPEYGTTGPVSVHPTTHRIPSKSQVRVTSDQDYIITSGVNGIDEDTDGDDAAPRKRREEWHSEGDSDVSDADSNSSFTFSLPSTDHTVPLEEKNHLGRKFTRTGTWRTIAPQTNSIHEEFRIVHSHYPPVSGDGDVTISLTIEKGTDDSSHSSDDDVFFRWQHIQQSDMNLQAFEEMAATAHKAVDHDSRLIYKLFDKVRAESERTLRTPQGGESQYLEGNLVFNHIQSAWSQSHTRKHSVMFFSLPYFRLEKFENRALNRKTNAHASRTLLQVLYSSSDRSRELQQAVCQLPQTKRNHGFHVDSAWCCMINDNFFTGGRFPACDLQGGSVRAIQQVKATSSQESKQPFLRVFGGSRKLWLLPIKSCETWLQFSAIFHRLGPSTRPGTSPCFRNHCLSCDDRQFYAVKRNGSIITAQSWPYVINEARQHLVTLELMKRLISKGPLSTSRFAFAGGAAEKSQESSDSSIKSEESSDDASSSGWGSIYETSETSYQSGIRTSQGTDGTRYQWSTVGSTMNDGATTVNTQTSSKKSSGTSGQSQIHVLTWKSKFQGPVESTKETSIPDTVGTRTSETRNAAAANSEHLKAESELIDRRLNELLGVLWNNPKSVERRVFRQCRQMTQKEVQEYIQLYPKTERHAIYDACKDIIEFFLDPARDSPLVTKFWGAVVQILLDMSSDVLSFGGTSSVLLRSSCVLIRKLKIQLSHGPEDRPKGVPIPLSFEKAWLHCLMGVIFVSVGARHDTSREHARKHFDRCRTHLLQGRLGLMRSLSGGRLASFEAVAPIVVVAKLFQRILQDVSPGQQDIEAVYWDYLSTLKPGLQSGPLQRDYQKKFNLLRQEVGAVLSVLDQQHHAVEYLEELIRTHHLDAKTGQTPDLSRLRETIVARQCATFVRSRIRAFREIDLQTQLLSEEHLRMLQIDKDKQEAAIYAFTIVTVIFLPLSFVTGIFGMNTTDIRALNKSQWVYWAVAIPLTLIVIGVSLHLADELRPVLRWFPSAFARLTAGTRNRQTMDGYGHLYSEHLPPFPPKPDQFRPVPPARLPGRYHFPMRSLGAREMLRRGMARNTARTAPELNA